MLKRQLKKLLFRVSLLLFQPLLSVFRRVSQGNEAYPLFSKYGYHLLRKHYYVPIPETDDFIFQGETELIGLDINEDICFDFLERVVLKYKSEFQAFSHVDTDGSQTFYLLNGNFMAIDGNIYHALIRSLCPAKIVEIGSGYSTLLAIQALSQNQQEAHPPSQLVCIEPYPGPMLEKILPPFCTLRKQKVQEIPVKFFESLQAGDILFIDSTHILRSGGDVWWEYCEILPRLRAGVYVHIHDISLPKPYPKVYADNHVYWNEQYLLQAFLAFNSRFEIIWPGNYLMTKYPERIGAVFSPEYRLMREKFPYSEPTSFWMRVKNF